MGAAIGVVYTRICVAGRFARADMKAIKRDLHICKHCGQKFPSPREAYFHEWACRGNKVEA